MYNKLRTIQKMLRNKILELEKLEKKHNKLLKKNESLVKENESLRIAFDSSQTENLKLKNILKEKESKPRQTKRRTRKNDSSEKSNPT